MRLGGEPWWRKVMTALQACGEDTRRHAEHQSLSRRNLFKAGAVVVAGPAVASGAIAATQSSSPPDLPSKSIMVGGFNQNVVDVGSGSAVLMLHGFPNDSTDWRHQIPELAKRVTG
jgi:hypothetical protein